MTIVYLTSYYCTPPLLRVAFVRGAFARGAFARGAFAQGAFVLNELLSPVALARSGFCPGVFVRGASVRGAFVRSPAEHHDTVLDCAQVVNHDVVGLRQQRWLAGQGRVMQVNRSVHG